MSAFDDWYELYPQGSCISACRLAFEAGRALGDTEGAERAAIIVWAQPYHSDKLLMSKVGLSGMITLLVSCFCDLDKISL